MPVAGGAAGAACEAITNTKGDAKDLSSRKYETPAGRNRVLTSEVSITVQRNPTCHPPPCLSLLSSNISLSVTLSCRWSLSEMFQKVQLAAMKNDKFYFVATVTQAESQAPPSPAHNPATVHPLSVPILPGFTLLVLFYYLSSLLRKQQQQQQQPGSQ